MKYKTSQLMITMGMDHIDGVSLLPTMLNSLFSVVCQLLVGEDEWLERDGV